MSIIVDGECRKFLRAEIEAMLAASARLRPPAPAGPPSAPEEPAMVGDVDYGELAVALLWRVARTLATAEVASAGSGQGAWVCLCIDHLEAQLVVLHRDLACTQAERRSLAEECEVLRARLEGVTRRLDVAASFLGGDEQLPTTCRS